MTPARFCRLSEPLPYSEAVRLQKRLVAERVADRIPDTVLLLEHPPVITLGRRGRTDHLLADPDRLAGAGIDLRISERGGDVTVHAPGQWVLYPILKLTSSELGTHGYLHALENIAIATAGEFGVDAFRREGMAGGWTAGGKFAAIGFKFTRWVSWHGMSINVNIDLGLFDLVVGCGLTGERVTSFRQLLGDSAPGMAEVGNALRRTCANVLAREWCDLHPKELEIPFD